MSNEKKNDGGPAFPGHGEQFIEGVHGIQPQSAYGMQGDPGMTLRDYFAAKSNAHMADGSGYAKEFIEAHMGSAMPSWRDPAFIKYMADFNAKMKFADADAMIKAREA